MIEDAEINTILGGHFTILDRDRNLFRRMRSAADNRLWEDENRWSNQLTDDTVLPVKVQVNTLAPWLKRNVSALYMRAPKPVVSAPTILASTSRGGINQDRADTMRIVGEQWLRRVAIRQQIEQALEMALLYPGAGLKLGYDKHLKGTPLDRVWLDPLPRWECIWDERAGALTERYRGHVRWETIERARELLEDDLVDVPTSPINDYLVDGTSPNSTDGHDRGSGYVQILDWYDLTDRKNPTFEVLLVSGGHRPSIDRRGKAKLPVEKLKVPYTWPDGSPLLTLEPVILSNSVGFPLLAIAQAKPIYEETCEKSLLLTIVLNAFRRDAARVILYLKSKGLTDEQVTRIATAIDTQFVGIEAEDETNIEKLFFPLVMPDLADTLHHAREWLTVSSAEQSTLSSLGKGSTQGLEYAPATTTQALAAGDQAVASAPAERMRLVLSTVTRAMFRILGQEGKGLKVKRGEGTVTLTPEHLRAAWEVEIEDAAATASSKAARRADLTTVLPVYLGLVSGASSTAPVGDPAYLPNEVKIANERAVDLIVDTFELGENLRWDALRGKKPDNEAEDPPEPTAGAEFTPAPAAPMPAAPVEAAPVPAEAATSSPEDALVARLATVPPEQLEALLAAVEQGA